MTNIHKENPKKSFWTSKWLLAIVIVFAIGVGFYSYHSYVVWANERQFAQARSDIDTVYGDIVTNVGQPDNIKRTNDCSRPSQEFTQGPLSCSVGTDFIYGVKNEQEANTMLKKIQSVIAAHPELLKATQPLAQAIKDTLVVNTYYHTAYDYFKSNKGLLCVASYIYDTPKETDLSLNDSSKKILEAGIACSGSASKHYYP